MSWVSLPHIIATSQPLQCRQSKKVCSKSQSWSLRWLSKRSRPEWSIETSTTCLHISKLVEIILTLLKPSIMLIQRTRVFLIYREARNRTSLYMQMYYRRVTVLRDWICRQTIRVAVQLKHLLASFASKNANSEKNIRPVEYSSPSMPITNKRWAAFSHWKSKRKSSV